MFWFETWGWKKIQGWNMEMKTFQGWNTRMKIFQGWDIQRTNPEAKSTFAIVDTNQMWWPISGSGLKHEDENNSRVQIWGWKYFRVGTRGCKYSRVEISKEPILNLSRLSPLWTRPKCDGLLHVFMTNIKTRIAVTTLGNVKNDSQCAVMSVRLWNSKDGGS